MSAMAPAMQAPRPAPRPTVKTWLMAARPKTLTAALVPVMVGTALAYGLGVARWLPALAALVGAMFIQVGTNLTNDYFDFKKGADTAERVGPQRVTQSGLISPGTVLASALGCFGLAVLTGIYLVGVGGWPIVAIGIASVLAGYSYTGGPFPLAYHGLGDVFVFVFFGLVAVPGTYYVQALTVAPAAWAAAVPVGAIGTALLVVNNLRDAATDVKAGKHTLVVRLGMRAGRLEYLGLLTLAFLTPPAMWALRLASPWVLLAWLSAPLAVPLLRQVWTQSGAALNPALGGTARLQLVFGLLFSVGLVVG